MKLDEPAASYPRIRNLPLRERKPFKRWLAGQTCPWIDGEAAQAQDAYYPWDYSRWKSGLSI